MTKKKFLSELEKKLSVLNESEIKDIMNEYNDIIDEKVKHGKTEKEAISDFGKIDDLVNEILSAYKINPNYNEESKDEFEASCKKLGEGFDDFIKKGAEKASKATKKVMEQVRENDQELTIEFVFELLFKAIIALLLCLVASIPFKIIAELGESVLEMFVIPFHGLFAFLFEFVLGIVFLVFCGFIFVAMFKPYVTPNKKKESKKLDKNNDELKKKEEKKLIKSNHKEGTDALGVVIITLMKVAIILFVLIPIWMMEFGIGVGLAFLIFGVIKGIYFVGPILLCIGGISLLSNISSLIYRMIFTNKKPYFYGIIVGLVCLVIGSFLTVDLVMSFKYIDEVPTGYKKSSYQEMVTINGMTIIDYHFYDNRMKYSMKTENTLPDNQLKIDVSYYSDIYQKPIILKDFDNGKNELEIELEDKNRSDFKFHYQMLINDLRKNQLHDYQKLEDYEVVVTGNEKTLSMIQLENDY